MRLLTFFSSFSFLSGLTGWQKFLLRLVAYTGFILLFIPGMFAYKAATPPRYHSSHTTPASFGLQYDPKTWKSVHGYALKGWFIPASDQRGIFILLHGIGDSKDAYLARAEMLVHQRYSVIIYDHRAHGGSGGSTCTLGIKEADDLLTVIQSVRAEYPAPVPVYVWGFSMGAACALMSLPANPGIDGVIADSSFTTLPEVFKHYARVLLHIPSFPMANIAHFQYRLFTGTLGNDLSPLTATTRTTRYPILFVVRELDVRIPPEQGKRLYEAYGGSHKSLWIMPGSDHLYSRISEKEYWEKIEDFLSRIS